jgi:quercetin dioxygenase-like cupin family protein
MASVQNWKSVEVEVLSPLLSRQCIHGKNITQARIELKKGCVIPEHRHPSEQFSHVLQGELTFRCGEQEITVHAGEVLTIPPDVPHVTIAAEDTLAIDTFSPPHRYWRDQGAALAASDRHS